MMEAIDYSIISGFLDGLKPIERISVSEWADKYRYLAPTASAEPGLWRTSRTPYLKEILDKLSSHDPVQEVVFMKGAQIGATEAANCWLGYLIDIAPCPILAVQPTDETVKRNSKVRIAPMIEATPRLKEKVGEARSRDSNNTTFSKSFPGGVLVMTGANSAVGLRSMPVKSLLLDEVDGFVQDLDGEGSPIELAKARTRTFSNRKIFIISTPTVEGASAVEKEFMSSDQRHYHVPCPHCGTMQTLKWSNLKWEDGNPETAQYECDHCGESIQERHKTSMLANGEWIALAPENSSVRKVGYHLNSLYSPFGWYSWTDAARDWEDAQGDVNKLKVFINTVLGETWKDKGEAPPWELLYNRREQYRVNTVPNEVALLTAGVDVQKDRLELEIVGWASGKRTWSIDYRVLMGDTAGPEVWSKLTAVVNEQWTREDGALMPLMMMAIDTGYNTSHVYEFCRRFDASKVVPVKGQERQAVMVAHPKLVDTTRSGKKVGKIQLWNVGVNLLKGELYGWLKQHKVDGEIEPPGYCHFPQYSDTYFRGLTAEQVEYRKNKQGFGAYVWVKKYERNEPLDCRVYARAAAAIIGIDRLDEAMWEKLRNSHAHVTSKQRASKPKKSSFWD
jgi:phage terminase large subunit GpA-like protein